MQEVGGSIPITSTNSFQIKALDPVKQWCYTKVRHFMFSPVYLMRSRHQVYYFRWPLPRTQHSPKPDHIRLSLRTREPKEALRLARTLEYHATQIIKAYELEKMNNSEVKAIVQEYLQNVLDVRKNEIIENGALSDEQVIQLTTSIQDAEKFNALAKDGIEAEDDKVMERIIHTMKLDIQPSSPDYKRLRSNYNLALPAALAEILRFNDEQRGFDFSPQQSNSSSLKTSKKYALDEISQKFVNMHMRDKQWDENTKKEKLSYIAVLKEIVGEKFDMSQMDAEKAREVRDITLRIPVNKNKDAKTKKLTLQQAIEVKGKQPIAAATVKKYLDCYKSLFAWAVNEAYIEKNPFLTLKGKALSKKHEDRRTAFSEDQIKTMLSELDTRRLAKKDYAYWGTLIGMYTGARVNEVAQIMLEDIKEEGGVWYFDMNDDGDGKKLKNSASRRRVPIHDALLQRGILEYADKLRKQGKKRLLHELTYCKKNGYGKNLGRFFNTKFLVELGMKNKRAVFHTLRHTVVTRLTQAGQDEKKINAIIGHKQSGTAMTTYFAEGFKMNDLKLVINTI